MRELPSLRECFAFPVSTKEARRDLLIGGTLLLSLLIGWIFNLGHRLDLVHRIYHRREPYFHGFAPWKQTFSRGLRACVAITIYLSPAALLAALAWWSWKGQAPRFALAATALAVACFLVAIYSLPGGMTYNAAYNDLSYLYRPDKAFRRSFAGGVVYLRAWLITLCAVSLSFLGLFAFGIGFLYSSVWAWTVAGYSFSKALVLSDPVAVTNRPDPTTG